MGWGEAQTRNMHRLLQRLAPRSCKTPALAQPATELSPQRSLPTHASSGTTRRSNSSMLFPMSWRPCATSPSSAAAAAASCRLRSLSSRKVKPILFQLARTGVRSRAAPCGWVGAWVCRWVGGCRCVQKGGGGMAAHNDCCKVSGVGVVCLRREEACCGTTAGCHQLPRWLAAAKASAFTRGHEEERDDKVGLDHKLIKWAQRVRQAVYQRACGRHSKAKQSAAQRVWQRRKRAEQINGACACVGAAGQALALG